MFLDFSNPNGKPVSVDYYGDRIEYPLKIDRFEFVDSQMEPSVRVADLLAGIAAEAATPMANRERPSPYQKDLMQAVIARNLVLNAMWPTRDVTPERLNAADHTEVNPASVAAEFLDSVHRVTGRPTT